MQKSILGKVNCHVAIFTFSILDTSGILQPKNKSMAGTREWNRAALWEFEAFLTSHGHPWNQLLEARILHYNVDQLDTILLTDEFAEVKMLVLGALYPALVDFQEIFSVKPLGRDEMYFRFQMQRFLQWFLDECSTFDAAVITAQQEEHLAQHLGGLWQLEDSWSGESIRVLLPRKMCDTLWMGRPEDMEIPEYFFEILWVVLNGDARGIPVNSAKEAFEYWILQLRGWGAEGYIEGGGVALSLTAEAEGKNETSRCAALKI